MTQPKDQYRHFCQQEKNLPIFLQPWWLDAVCTHGPWNAAIAYDTKINENINENINAVMPYYTVKGKLGHTYLTMPQLTQFLGPWLRYPPNQKPDRKLSYQKETMKTLINALPPFDEFIQNFHHSHTNWLPFYWEKFQQTTRYTYIINDLTDTDAIFKNLRGNIRREIRKAEKQVKITTDNDIEKFHHIAQQTYQRQNLTYPRTLDFLKRIDTACAQNNSRAIYFAHDTTGQTHAALYIIWDNQSAYHLMSGGNPDLRTSGATSLLMWHAIQNAAQYTQTFDFEGSMIQPIERFFSSFGTKQTPYFQVTKTNSRYLKIKKAVNEILKK